MRKRLRALILTLVMAITLILGNTTRAMASTNDSMDAYAAEEVVSFLHANGVWENGNFLSQAYPIYHVSEECISHYMYFVLNDNEVVGRLAVYGNVGEYVSSYVHGAIEGMDISSPFLLFMAEDSLFLRQGENDVYVSGEVHNVIVENEIPLSTQILQENIQITSSTVSGRMTHYYLAVPHVANDEVNGVGLCWAACIAARANYHEGAANHSAMSVYNHCNAYLTGRPSGTPVGNETWIQYGYSLYGISTECVMSGKNFAQICDLLNKNKPIHCGVSNSSVGSHGVLLIGVYQEGSTNVYMFRDPNESGVVSIHVSAAALDDPSLITYTNSDYSYDDWFRSIY